MNEYVPKHRAEIQGSRGLGRVPSFAEVAGPEAAEKYHRIRHDQDAQELANRSQFRAAHGLGLCSIEAMLILEEQVELQLDIMSLSRSRVPAPKDLGIILD
jgi:hypothetical protein